MLNDNASYETAQILPGPEELAATAEEYGLSIQFVCPRCHEAYSGIDCPCNQATPTQEQTPAAPDWSVQNPDAPLGIQVIDPHKLTLVDFSQEPPALAPLSNPYTEDVSTRLVSARITDRYVYVLEGEQVVEAYDRQKDKSLLPNSLPPIIALAGFADAGKDEVTQILSGYGYARHSMGDIIKRQLNPLIQRHFGFDAHTEDRRLKERIRPLLETWGKLNHHAILEEIFGTRPTLMVENRLMQVDYAQRVLNLGGEVWYVSRASGTAISEYEHETLMRLFDQGLISRVVQNDGTLEDLKSNVDLLMSLKR